MTTYWRSDDAGVMEAWRVGNERLDALNKRIEVWRADYPDFHVMVIRDIERYAVTGLANKTGREAPGPLWRRGKQAWVPSKGTKDGKALYAQMAALREDHPFDFPGGMPLMVIDRGRWLHPGVREMDSAVWFSWDCDEVELREWSKTFDDTIWHQVKASEWHLAVEAADAAKVAS